MHIDTVKYVENGERTFRVLQVSDSEVMNLQTNSYARRKSRIKQDKMKGLEDDRSFEEIIDGI